MTQQPVGSVKLVTAQGEETLPIEHHNLYVQGISRFVEAIHGAELACDGVAGYRSMAVAMATLESAKTGTTVTVDYGEFRPD
jgi:1,5-anhydro-D-fructose reductase (1,5-anhydro-D-mannitol-forming)